MILTYKIYLQDSRIEAIWNDAAQGNPGPAMTQGQSEVFELGFGPSWTLDYLEPEESAL